MLAHEPDSFFWKPAHILYEKSKPYHIKFHFIIENGLRSQKCSDVILNGISLFCDTDFIIEKPISQIGYNCEIPVVFMKSVTQKVQRNIRIVNRYLIAFHNLFLYTYGNEFIKQKLQRKECGGRTYG